MIWIVQKKIPHYREDFFVLLNTILKNVVIIHSSILQSDSLVTNTKFDFCNILVKIINTPFGYYQPIAYKFLKEKPKYVVLGLELKILSNYIIWFLSLFTKTKLVWWTHGYNVHIINSGFRFYIDRIIKTLLMKQCYAVLLYTKYKNDELIAWGVDRNKIVVLNNALNEQPLYESFMNTLKNSDHSDIVNSKSKNNNSSLTLTFVGRLVESKKVHKLLQLVNILKYKIPNLRLYIIGDGDRRLYLENCAKEMNLTDCVFFTGTIQDPNELAKYMLITDFTVYTGTVGLAIVHSFIYGIPFLALEGKGHSPEISYLENNKNGYMAKNLDDMADWILNAYCNPQLIGKMKRECRQLIINEVNIKNMVSNFISVFKE
ncbi:MAG: hypothetical protein CVU60_03265 [Deltaproteobacteria bacterium HGW-Deltaproteobacteria-18]|jgi:glycosyltransferase involved in cell wall biosynthesis|nr:MAG: hypothetical protein CVU60_03265 [Deltaproteobacteria bacterium HGW-Deltaproteobacteria-18]